MNQLATVDLSTGEIVEAASVFHPACLKLPRMASHEYEALKASLAKGWDNNKEPILRCGGLILDGRHRYLACEELGIEPVFMDWIGGNPFRFVWQQHDARRHWRSDEQRQLCFNDCEESAKEWEVEHQRILEEANKARSEKAKGNQNASKTEEENSAGTNSARTVSRPSGKGRKKKAEAAGTNRGAVQRVAKLEKLAKELGMLEIVQQVRQGERSAHNALKLLEEEKRKKELARPVRIELAAGLHRGDFRALADQIADSSVDLVFTDPPYDGDSVVLYEDAARVASRILKPGGSFIAYSGQRHLPAVLAGCEKHLRYWWTIAGVHSGANQMLQKLGIRCGWKPLVWFVKDTRGDVQNVLRDVVTGDREKDSHVWQQAEEEALYYIEHLTSQGGLVVDFFVGGGTTAVAAKKLGRQFIGFEVDASAAERASTRMNRELAA